MWMMMMIRFILSIVWQSHILNYAKQHSAAAAISILWWTNAVCLPTIATIGLICNGLNLLVLAGNQHARRMPSWSIISHAFNSSGPSIPGICWLLWPFLIPFFSFLPSLNCPFLFQSLPIGIPLFLPTLGLSSIFGCLPLASTKPQFCLSSSASSPSSYL
jgi:hypothetical protein